MVERLWNPDSASSGDDESDEVILEPFCKSFEFSFVAPELQIAGQSITCISGAMCPLPSDERPAPSRHGLDFVGQRDGEAQHIALGGKRNLQLPFGATDMYGTDK